MGFLLVALLSALLGNLVVPSTALATGPRWAYSYASAFCEPWTKIDPVNVVFIGAPYWPSLDFHFVHDLPEWNWASNNPGQAAPDTNDACRGMVRDRATNSGSGFDFFSNRYHARFLEYGFEETEHGESRDWHMHATAHHEERGFVSTPDGWIGECGHAVTSNGFNQARDEVVRGFLAQGHRRVKHEYHNNVEMMGQCNGTAVSSDGYISFISLYYPDHGATP